MEAISKIITSTGKFQWSNAVKFISQLEETDQIRFVPQMLFLLQDLNWPGALEATKLMSGLKQSELEPHIINALNEANDEKDTIWIAWIKNLIEECKMDKLKIEYKEILEKAEW